MEYIITMMVEDGEEEMYGFPDTENMYKFLDMLSEDGICIIDVENHIRFGRDQ